MSEIPVVDVLDAEGNIVLTPLTVTCRTPGCWNEGIPITLPCVARVVCGACSQPILEKRSVV